MPDGFIQLPADGAGKKLKTFDTGTEHIQYVFLGAPFATYTAETPAVVPAANGSAKEFFAMINPVGSSKIVRVRSIWVSMTGIVLSKFEVYARRITAVVGGTAINATKNDTTNANTAVTTLVHSPTSATNALTTALWSSRWSVALAGATTAIQQYGDVPGAVIRFGQDGQQAPTFRAAEGMGISMTTRIAPGTTGIYVGVEWTEE